MLGSNAIVLALAGLAAAQTTTPSSGFTTVGVPSNGTVVTVTKVYTAYTTVCPGPTQFTFNGKKYTALSSCTLTITDCPCTVIETKVPGAKSTSKAVSASKTSAATKSTNKPAEQPYVEKSTAASGAKPTSTPAVKTGGAGAVKVSFGLAAAVGLLAL